MVLVVLWREHRDDVSEGGVKCISLSRQNVENGGGRKEMPFSFLKFK